MYAPVRIFDKGKASKVYINKDSIFLFSNKLGGTIFIMTHTRAYHTKKLYCDQQGFYIYTKDLEKTLMYN